MISKDELGKKVVLYKRSKIIVNLRLNNVVNPMFQNGNNKIYSNVRTKYSYERNPAEYAG